ncbi:ATP-binding protein [Mucilaginibacter ginsenosidivorans]|uniref:ATP-binding protein n=1 Tax=Mucilaginibacter ginsenosidivorans TaxID=398053 RepID=A0A5B8UZL4_9SPHI|nr:ATP-binding protein [Mucilaginibacter ginsenosidivorans]QEC63726.1 ATP-binding protein [Mucilaginibacter ginsenosidivorans]
MDLNKIGYLVNEGLYYPAVLNEVGKNGVPLQPLFEGFTNAIEAIAGLTSPASQHQITVRVYYDPDLFDEKQMNQIIIEDTGIGFNDQEFQRFLTFKDTRKGFHNRGSGRLQLIHFFSSVQYNSVFEENGVLKARKFHLSKSAPFLKVNAIAYLDEYGLSEDSYSHTSLSLSGLLSAKDQAAYNMTLANYKEAIINRYIQYFCIHRNTLPKIILQAYKGNVPDELLEITAADIPALDSQKDFSLNYQTLDGLRFQEKTEEFTVQAFRIPKTKLGKNVITLTSKGEIVEEKDFQLTLDILRPEDHVGDNRFLFLVSSPYINDRDSDIRGQLRIPWRNDDLSLFDGDIIYMDDIESGTNETIVKMYDELADKAEEKLARLSALKEMFLLNDHFLNSLNISINDTEEKILEKVYVHESRLAAKGDAELKKQYDQLTLLDPKAKDYDNELNRIVNQLVKEIPHQNRAALTHYVARRKLVLELFQQVLDRNLEIQQKGRNEDEKLLHNILFTQGGEAAEQSDLWILNEDFILFKGVSETRLEDITIAGEKIFKETRTAEEEAFVNANREKRLTKRPDVLLFPAEEKCIILEFKTPDTNVADHLAEINYYASLILNLTKDQFPFKTFYGYLIGETLEPLDIKFNDSDFQDSAHFDYAFRPAKRILGVFKNFQGSLYTEVLKYSTLLRRANKRNEALISKLFPSADDNDEPF